MVGMLYLSVDVDLEWFTQPLLDSGYGVEIRKVEDEGCMYYRIKILEKGC